MDRMKGSVGKGQLIDRLSYDLALYEIHMNESDLDRLDEIESVVRFLQLNGVKVYLHHPKEINGVFLNAVSEDVGERAFYYYQLGRLVEMAKRVGVKVVMHWNYTVMDDRLDRNREYTDDEVSELYEVMAFMKPWTEGVVLWENSCYGLGSYANERLIDEVIKPLDLSLCVDVSHAFISTGGDNDKLYRIMEETAPYAEYYHVVDSMGKDHDEKIVGEGLIDWSRIVTFIKEKDYVFEVGLADLEDAKEQYVSRIMFDEYR